MITVIEPKEEILKLWGNQPVVETTVYRIMRYVLREDYDGKVLLHNAVTGHLVVLDQEEAKEFNRLPNHYVPLLKPLILNRFLVPEKYDEHRCVSGMRTVLRKIADKKEKANLTFYTILPTTACNARCYYCFEKGIEYATMTQDTAKDVIEFITSHCNGKKVWLKWFGGEPTVAANRISQICLGLRRNNVSFSSIMTTNGYLFDDKMVYEARHLWNLKRVTLSMDGTGQNYNRIKNYIGACNDPYKQILRNIGLLIEQGIHVLARMNFDQENFMDFENLLSDIHELYPPTPLIEIRAHFINDVQIVDGVPKYHGSKKWYNEKVLELNQLSRSLGYLHKNSYLPSLSYKWCPAASLRSVTITPQGNLVSCYELLNSDEIKGNVRKGVTNRDIVDSWLQYSDETECSKCVLFPYCAKILKCPRNNCCYQRTELLYEAKKSIIDTYNSLCE